MTTRRFMWIAGGIVFLAAIVLVGVFDPSESVWMPKCIVHTLTGWQCPGCGITRAAHALLHGRVAEAFAYNRFFIISIPYLAAVAVVTYIPALQRRACLRRVVLGPELAIIYVVLFCIWFVVRNLLGI